MVQAGLVMLADAGPGRALYEAGTEWHHHFVCASCGRIEDVPCLTGAKPCLSPQGLDAEVEEAQIIFRGRCRRCRPRA